jgi:hypothetical protein
MSTAVAFPLVFSRPKFFGYCSPDYGFAALRARVREHERRAMTKRAIMGQGGPMKPMGILWMTTATTVVSQIQAGQGAPSTEIGRFIGICQAKAVPGLFESVGFPAGSE